MRTMHNKTEPSPRLHSERFYFVLGEGWYFRSREGVKGPHVSRAMAEYSLETLKEIFPDRRQVVYPEDPQTT